MQGSRLEASSRGSGEPLTIEQTVTDAALKLTALLWTPVAWAGARGHGIGTGAVL